MIAVDVDALDAARAAATPGEWIAATAPSEGSDETHAEYLVNGLRPDEGRPLWVAWASKVPGTHDDEDDAYVVPVVTGDGPTSEANAAYIVAMHAALPELLAEVRRGRALREAVEGLAEDLDSYVAGRGKPKTGTYDDGLNRAQAATATDLRVILDAS